MSSDPDKNLISQLASPESYQPVALPSPYYPRRMREEWVPREEAENIFLALHEGLVRSVPMCKDASWPQGICTETGGNTTLEKMHIYSTNKLNDSINSMVSIS